MDNIVPSKFAIRVSIDPHSEEAQESVKQQETNLPPAPQARRVNNRKASFKDQYETRSLSIDKRLLPYLDDLLEQGPNKTVVANQWVLKILLDAGYEVDPAILTKPFK